MVGIILAGGHGNRLKQSFNDSCCKPLVKIKDKMLIEFSLRTLIELEVKEACIVIGRDGDSIQNIIGNSYKGLKISYVRQEDADGPANALTLALDYVKHDGVILLLADEIFTGFRAESMKSHILNSEYDFYCGFTYEDNAEKIRGNYSVETDEHFHILTCTEKPETVTNNLKGTGFCIFNRNALNILKQAASPVYDLCDYINLLIERHQKGLAVHVAEKEFNINTFDDLKEVCCFLDKG